MFLDLEKFIVFPLFNLKQLTSKNLSPTIPLFLMTSTFVFSSIGFERGKPPAGGGLGPIGFAINIDFTNGIFNNFALIKIKIYPI